MRNEIGKQCTGYEHIGKVTSVVCFLIISMWHIYLMIILILIFTMMIIMMKAISIMIPSETMMIMMMMRMIFTTETMALDCVR